MEQHGDGPTLASERRLDRSLRSVNDPPCRIQRAIAICDRIPEPELGIVERASEQSLQAAWERRSAELDDEAGHP